jgi:hypothetical protein
MLTKEGITLDSIIDTLKGLFSTKAGARHSSKDNASVQAIHEAAVELGANCGFSIFKAADGKYRWLLTSSTAFEDRDGEIVSTKAQEADVDRMDATKEFGPLRFFHVGAPKMEKAGDWESYVAGNGVDLGVCDFSMMQGKSRIESGTFYDEKVAEALIPHIDKMGVSIGFSHPPDEPKNNVLYNIKTFERSLIYPRGKESNYFTSVAIMQKESTMDVKEKLEQLKLLVGPDLFATVTSQAEATEKAAESAGLKFKEGEQPTDTPVEEKAKTSRKVSDMTEDELVEVMNKCMDGYMERSAKTRTEKEAQADKAMNELQASLKQAQDADAHILETLETVKADLTKSKEVQSKSIAVLNELAGDLPRSLAKGFRASQDDSTVTTKEAPQAAGPKSDDFFAYVLGQTNVPTAG